MNPKDEISILFSGGSDSTLAAALMCEKFKRVHLLTFFHLGIPYAENSKINAEKLINKYGKDKIKYEMINFEEIFKMIYYGRYLKDLKKYKMYMTSNFCNACQLAMHTKTIMYNIKNDIHFTCDGYKQEKRHIYSFMSDDGIKETMKFYKEFGIAYKNPVYSIVRTDWKLFEMGITSKKNVKFPNEWINYSTQHHCRNGILVNAFLLGYYIPIYGYNINKNISLNYWKEKIKILKRYIFETIKLDDI